MIAFVVLAVLASADFSWVAMRVRREWARSDHLSARAAWGISSLYLAAAALIVAALALKPWPIGISTGLAIATGAVLVLAGVALAVVGARPFGSAPRLYGVDTGGLVQGGIYALSRNPQYAGLVLAIVGVAIAGRSTLTLALGGIVAGAFWLWVVAVEEPHLRATFGARYENYCATVPRFAGLPRRSSA